MDISHKHPALDLLYMVNINMKSSFTFTCPHTLGTPWKHFSYKLHIN